MRLVTDYRWASIENAAGAEIPAYALVRKTGRPTRAEFTVAMPNENDQSPADLLVNGDVNIPLTIGTDPGRGNATPEFPIQILYNPADGTPAVGQTWGAKAGEWWLRKNYKGFRIDGGADGSKVWATPDCCEEDCGCSGGGTTGGCQVAPPPKCAPCLQVKVLDSYGTPVSGVIMGSSFSTGGVTSCSYSGTVGDVEVGISVGPNGTKTILHSQHLPNWIEVHYESCTAWDGASCLIIGSQVWQTGAGSIGIPRVLEACPIECPTGGGTGGGGIGGGTGGTGTGGGCFTGPCPPNYAGNQCPCCTGTRPVQLNDGNWGCANNYPGIQGGNNFGGGGDLIGPLFKAPDPLNNAYAYAEELVDEVTASIPAVLTGTSTPTSLSANVNNYAPNTGLAAMLRIQTDGSGVKNITGIAGGVDGYRMIVKNVGAQSINLTEEDAASTAANRFNHDSGLSHSLVAGAKIEYIYDGATSRWEQV